MRFISLFSGVGGFDLGFERAGMRCVAQVEIDVRCQQVLNYHWPHVLRHSDVREVYFAPGTADLVCGGFPCQDVSIAGRRAGLAGERSGLWHEFRRILEQSRPAWVVVENVPGLLSSNGGRDFAVVIQGLAQLGYGVCWRVLDAQYFGVAQRRRRVFIVGHLGDGRAAQALFEPEGGAGDSAASGEAEQGVATYAEGGFGGYSSDARVTPFVNQGDPNASEDNIHYALDTRPWHCVAYNWQSGGDVRLGFGLPTLSASQVPAVGVRRLTPTECARLQGFPSDWLEVTNADEAQASQDWPLRYAQPEGKKGKELSDSARYRMMGNAVCVPVAEWIGRRILGVR